LGHDNLQRRQVAYLTDSGAGAIVVVDLAAGTAVSRHHPGGARCAGASHGVCRQPEVGIDLVP